MKFLIDECLSPVLAKLARDSGYPGSSHVCWLRLAGTKDHVVTRRAVDDGYVLVTHNTTDFHGLYGREDVHVGLVAFNAAPGLMSLGPQVRLFVSLYRNWAARRHGMKCSRSQWMRNGS